MLTRNPRHEEELTAVCRFDMRRFTHYEHDRGDTTGWRFTAGWFTRDSGLRWAWFSREADDGEA